MSVSVSVSVSVPWGSSLTVMMNCLFRDAAATL